MRCVYPIRLREDWHDAYTGFDPTTEIPQGMTEDHARDFFKAVAQYNLYLRQEGQVSVNNIARNICSASLKDSKLPSQYSKTHGTLTGLESYYVDYLKDVTGLGKKGLRKAGISSVKIPFTASAMVELTDYIEVHAGQNPFMDFLKFWAGRVKAQYVQPALLHAGDTLDNVQKGVPEMAQDVDVLKRAYHDSGLAEAVAQIRALVPVETGSEKITRQAYQLTVDEAYNASDFKTIQTLSLA